MSSVGRTRSRELNRLAEAQFGVITRAQALACGYSDSAITRCIGDGLWERAHRGVYRLAPAARGFQADVMALVLRAPGRTWASHRAAAFLWGLEPDDEPVAEVSTTANVRHGHIHQVRQMPAGDRRALGGLPCTSIERTLVDVGTVVTPRRLEAMVVAACRRGATTTERLWARLATPAGRRGPPHLRKVLDGWDQLAAPESALEVSLRRLMKRHRLPQGEPQWVVTDRGRIVARVDVAYPDRMIAVEADGYRWHGDAARWKKDLARRNALAQLGWRVLHFTWSDVRNEPERVAREIRNALRTSKSPAGREKTTS